MQFEEHLVGQALARHRTNYHGHHTPSSPSWRHSGAWPFSAWPSSSTLSIWSPSSMSTSSAQSSLACALSRSTPQKRLQNDWSYMSVCAIGKQQSYQMIHPLTQYSRRWPPRRQSLPILPRSVTRRLKRLGLLGASTIGTLPPISSSRTWHFRCLSHPRPHRIQTWPCCPDCRLVRGCVGRYHRLEIEPGQLRQRFQQEQAYMELG